MPQKTSAFRRQPCFHPLKAGRRPRFARGFFPGGLGFHPLKAGRRLVQVLNCFAFRECFHPLKAGRRLPIDCVLAQPSNVSIPSRRVGDKSWRSSFLSLNSFHPLKAGRRPYWRNLIAAFLEVSIPSRRVGDALEGWMCALIGLMFPSPQGGSETGS